MKKILVLANLVQSLGTYMIVIGGIALFIPPVPLKICGLTMALGAFLHIAAMLFGMKMDGSGRLPREHLKKGPTA